MTSAECAAKVAALNDGMTGVLTNATNARCGTDQYFSSTFSECGPVRKCKGRVDGDPQNEHDANSTYSSRNATSFSNAVCSPCDDCRDDKGESVATECTPHLNTVCSFSSGSEKSSAGAITGITIMVLLMLAGAGIGLMYHSKARQATTFKQKDALHERLLEETRGDLEESQASNTRMRAAWQIKKDDVTVEQLMAEGTSGKVHAGWYAGHKVAVKVLKQALDPELGPEVTEDFARECETLMSIRHASLLIFYGTGTMSDNRPFIVTEYMALGSLKTVLADRDRVLGWPARIRLAAQVADGMAYLHSLKIVHRDLKSDNVLLDNDLDAKVADFGTSKLVTASRTRLQTAGATGETSFGGDDQMQSEAFQATMTKGVGTPLWMAPELFVGGTKYGPEVDIYSFGMIMWELATRKVPWAEEIAETQYIYFFGALSKALEDGNRPGVPAEAVQVAPEFVALMQQCWATDAGVRPAAAAVAAKLLVAP